MMMPNCFALTKKGESQPAKFQDIDEELCKQFNAPCHPELWYKGWYDVIGLGLAMGKSFDEIKTLCPEYAAECDWLNEHYTADAWYESGRP